MSWEPNMTYAGVLFLHIDTAELEESLQEPAPPVGITTQSLLPLGAP